MLKFYIHHEIINMADLLQRNLMFIYYYTIWKKITKYHYTRLQTLFFSKITELWKSLWLSIHLF